VQWGQRDALKSVSVRQELAAPGSEQQEAQLLAVAALPPVFVPQAVWEPVL